MPFAYIEFSIQIKISEFPKIYVFDTPGILHPNVEDMEVAMNLALCGKYMEDMEVAMNLALCGKCIEVMEVAMNLVLCGKYIEDMKVAVNLALCGK